jgi:biopolymer transport protein ExbD
MPMPVPKTEETTLNMTPMIDIVFQLVTFFLLTLDLAQKEFVEVDLPVAYKGISEEGLVEGEIPRFIINLIADGKVQFKGQTYDLAATPAEQDAALKALRDHLFALTNDPKLREEDGASKVSVMVHGDRSAKWEYTQWVMMVCAHPRIKIYKIQFAVKHPIVEGA